MVLKGFTWKVRIGFTLALPGSDSLIQRFWLPLVAACLEVTGSEFCFFAEAFSTFPFVRSFPLYHPSKRSPLRADCRYLFSFLLIPPELLFNVESCQLFPESDNMSKKVKGKKKSDPSVTRTQDLKSPKVRSQEQWPL